jgi:hypothetical protein
MADLFISEEVSEIFGLRLYINYDMNNSQKALSNPFS